MEDEEIVDLFLAREEEAISITQEKYGRQLIGLSMKVVDDHGAAEECVNESYLKTWNSIPPHEPRTYFFAFLAKIVRGLSLDHYKMMRAQKRQSHMVMLSDELDLFVSGPDSTERVIDDMVLSDSLNGFLRSQPEEKRDIFIRRYWFFDDINDISKRFGYSPSKIKSMMMRMRNQLKERLEADGVL